MAIDLTHRSRIGSDKKRTSRGVAIDCLPPGEGTPPDDIIVDDDGGVVLVPRSLTTARRAFDERSTSA
jgi:regulator of RNase E activity RraA